MATFTFLGSDDKTHTISGMYQWTLAEMTCQFLAFCAPSMPRAFAHKKKISHFITSFIFRMSQKERSSGSRVKSTSWPSPPPYMKPKRWDASKVYHRIKDTTMPLVKYPSSHSINEQEVGDITRPGGGILMTTHFTAEITVVSEGDDNAPSSQEYPWATRDNRIERSTL